VRQREGKWQRHTKQGGRPPSKTYLLPTTALQLMNKDSCGCQILNGIGYCCFLLLTFLAYNLFHAFFALNLKAAARKDTSEVLWACLMTAEFLQEMAFPNRFPLSLLPPAPCSA
jgi:hypothetical protein